MLMGIILRCAVTGAERKKFSTRFTMRAKSLKVKNLQVYLPPIIEKPPIGAIPYCICLHGAGDDQNGLGYNWG